MDAQTSSKRAINQDFCDIQCFLYQTDKKSNHLVIHHAGEQVGRQTLSYFADGEHKLVQILQRIIKKHNPKCEVHINLTQQIVS